MEKVKTILKNLGVSFQESAGALVLENGRIFKEPYQGYICFEFDEQEPAIAENDSALASWVEAYVTSPARFAEVVREHETIQQFETLALYAKSLSNLYKDTIKHRNLARNYMDTDERKAAFKKEFGDIDRFWLSNSEWRERVEDIEHAVERAGSALVAPLLEYGGEDDELPY